MKKKNESCYRILKKTINYLAFSPSLHVPKKRFLQVFQDKALVVVDVGATGGLEKRWRFIQDLCRFFTFDPDCRVENLDQKDLNFAIGLWSKKTNKILQLAAFPSASTLYPFQQKTLSAFTNADCHTVVDFQEINLDTMENILEGKAIPDFIKIDAEGADLEILKGAELFLKKNCLGVQIEVSFCERHVGAPFFSEIDGYLRDQGFMLLDLEKVRWIRKNNFFGLFSKPQVVWANAVYMKPIDLFLNSLENLSLKEKEHSFLKFLLLLLIYQMHDYAEELRQKIFQKNWIGLEINKLSQKTIAKAIPSKIRFFSGLFWNFCLSLAGFGLFFWIKSVRQQMIIFFKKQVHLLAQGILNCLKTGPCQNELSDEE
jgi:FkbM family methyltransferase